MPKFYIIVRIFFSLRTLIIKSVFFTSLYDQDRVKLVNFCRRMSNFCKNLGAKICLNLLNYGHSVLITF